MQRVCILEFSHRKPPKRSTTTVHGIQCKHDDSSIVNMDNAMVRLLNVFLKTETNESKATNRWCLRTFNTLATYEAVSLSDTDDIRADTLWHNKPARMTYETFIRVIPEDRNTTSITWLHTWTHGGQQSMRISNFAWNASVADVWNYLYWRRGAHNCYL